MGENACLFQCQLHSTWEPCKEKQSQTRTDLQDSITKRSGKRTLNDLSEAQDSIQNLIEVPIPILPLIKQSMFKLEWAKKFSNLAMEFQTPVMRFLWGRISQHLGELWIAKINFLHKLFSSVLNLYHQLVNMATFLSLRGDKPKPHLTLEWWQHSKQSNLYSLSYHPLPT